MELIKIINARNIFNKFVDRNDIGFHLSYWMTKFIAKTENDERFYMSELQKIIKKYAKNQDETLHIPEEHIDIFNSEVEKLEKTKVEDPMIRFNLSELAEELKMSMRQIYPLLDFIDEDK